MNKFIIDVISCLFFPIIVIYLFYNIKRDDFANQMRKFPQDIEVVNLGTSHGHGFNYSILDLQCANLSRDGNTIFYDVQNYLYIKDKIKKGKIVILPISLHSFGQYENSMDERNNSSFLNQYYEYLPAKSIFNFSLSKYLNVIIFKAQNNLKFLFTKDDKKDRNQIFKTKYQLVNHAENRVKRHKKLNSSGSVERNFNYLNDFFNYSEKLGHQVVVVTMPYYYQYKLNYGSEWLNENYYSHIDALMNKYEFVYYDFSDDSTLINNPKLYKDSDHLNEFGSKVFSEKFFSALKDDFPELRFKSVKYK